MKCFAKLGALALFFFATSAVANEDPENADSAEDTLPSDVHALKSDEFNDFISSHPLVLAEFYAPWCGHCNALAPEYEKAATHLKEKNIPLVKVDCTEEQTICQEYDIGGYPTIKVFRGLDTHTPYGGARKADSIISYMVKQSLPAVSILDTDTITDFKTADNLVVIAYLDAEDKESIEIFTEAASTLRNDYLFGSTTDSTLAEAEGVKAPTVIIYKSFDDPKTVYDGSLVADELESFIKAASIPLIGEVGPETYSGYIQSGLPLAYIFCADEESKAKLSEAIRPIAQKYKGKINFGTLDAAAYGAHASNVNLEVGKWPAFAIQETAKNAKFPYDQDAEITEETISKFVQDYVDGKISPSIKSEPIPETQEGPVHVVVAHSYDEIVIGSDKDVLLEFYAPWCGHCKNLAPQYEELASLYFNNPEYSDKVTVAKIDATANDTPDEITGFPTIKLYPAGKKDTPINYEGDRTVEDMANFIRDSGSHKIDAWVPPPEGEEKLEEEQVDEPAEEEVGKEEEETSKEEGAEEVQEHVKPVEEVIHGEL